MFVSELCVDFAIHAADEEARYRAQQIYGLSGGDARFQAVDVGFQCLAVTLRREEQGRIDVHAFYGEFADGFDARQCRRDFDHDVFATDAAVKFQRLGNGFAAVVREVGRDFERDHAVGAAGLFVHRQEEVAGLADVVNGEAVEGVAGAAVRVFVEPAAQRGVVGVASKGFLEDGRVGGDAAQVVISDEVRQFAAGEHAPLDVVVPNALPECCQLAQRVDGLCGRHFQRVVGVFAQFAGGQQCRGGRSIGGLVQQGNQSGRFGIRRRQRFDFGKGRCFFRCGRSLCGFRRIVAQFFDQSGSGQLVFCRSQRALLRYVVRLALAAYGVDVARAAFAHATTVDFFRRIEQRLKGGIDVIFRQGAAARFFAARRSSRGFFTHDVLLQRFFVTARRFFLALVFAIAVFVVARCLTRFLHAFGLGFGGFTRWLRRFLPFAALAAITRRGGAFATFVASGVFRRFFNGTRRVAVFFEQGNDFGEQRRQSAFLYGRRDLRRRGARHDALYSRLFGDGFARLGHNVAFFVAFVAGTQAVARCRCGVFVQLVIAQALDVVVRRVQVGIRHQHDFHFVALLNLADDRTFFVQQIGGDAHRQLTGDAAGALFHRFFFNQTQE